MKNAVLKLIAIVLIPGLNLYAGSVELEMGKFSLSFASDGRPASIKTIPQNEELLDTLTPGAGFYLKCKGDALIPMTNVTVKDGELIVSAEFGTPQVTFSVKKADGYAVFRIERLKSMTVQNDLSLHFEMKTIGGVRAIALDYMTDVADVNGCITVDWNNLSNRHPDNPLGGFAIFYGADEAEEDEALLQIWANENLPHPKIEGCWNYNTAKKWLADWQGIFADQSRLWLDASNLDELYEGVKYAQMADIKEIFLFCNVWRGDPFWPVSKLNWEINKNIFPNGQEDVRKYSDYLKSKGINLKFHYVSGGMGKYDPKYIGNKPDRRLASWGGGKAAQEVGASDTTIHFIPDKGVELPYRMPRDLWDYLPSRSYALQHFFDYEIMRIDDELIKVKEFDDTDKAVWILRGCERGLYNTDPVSHSKDAEMAGIITAYGQNFIPDNDSALLHELAENYAKMLNNCGVSHSEFDGAEIHTYNGRMWGYNKFATLIYQNLDHPLTANSSGAEPPPCFIEYYFNSSRKLLGRSGYHGYGAPILLHQPSRVSSSLLDAHWALSLQAVQNFRRFNVSKPEPLFGVSIDMFKGLGITEQISSSVRNWKAASRLMSESQKQSILKTLGYPESPLFLADGVDRHPSSSVVHTAHKTDDGYKIVPVKVLTRKEGDVMWHKGQEHGPISPKQYIKPSDKLKLENIYKPQPVKFIIRVMWATDYEDEQNKILQPDIAEIKDLRDTRFNQQGDALIVSSENTRGEGIWEESKLPYWEHKVKMMGHRAVGMYVTGDGSESILVFQIPGRDYVVPVNFKGRRYIEIPNGEAAWANGFWGWRMGSKRTDYERVNTLKLGFGHIPKQTNARIKVEGLKALKEIDTELVNPVIHTGKGTLEVSGNIASGQYLEYKCGDKVTVYDENWNKVKELPVEKCNYEMDKGWSEVSVTTSQKKPLPWLEVQFMTEGEPIMVSEKCKENSLGFPYRVSKEELQWLRDAKFGLFIHWGPVSVSGGELSWSRGAKRSFDVADGGTPSETGWDRLLVPGERYDNLYKEFNPVKFDADQWVRIAKDAGMKYMVFTAKHHDGFSNFDTKVSEHDIMSGPFKRDIVGELAAACQKGGIKFGPYYSPRDWYHPDYLIGDNSKYNAFMHEQIRELLSNYGKIDIMWFDSFGESDLERDWNISELLTMIRNIQPGILVNNRLAILGSYNKGPKKYWGDYDTPEQKVGKFQTDRPWESCITLVGHQWSWKPGGEMFSLKECIDKLVMCVCGDGNLLLNIGPMPTGEIEARQVARLKEMGDWLSKYGESIYGTRGGPIVPGSWGGTTYKGKTVYVHVLNWGEDTISLPAMPKIVKYSVLTGGKAAVKQDGNGVKISVRKKYRKPLDTIIKLKLEREATVVQSIPQKGS